jgi:hypothetical protein
LALGKTKHQQSNSSKDFDNVDKDEEQLKVWHWPENQEDLLFKQALEVKIWVTNCIEKTTFPREDYRELCELIRLVLPTSFVFQHLTNLLLLMSTLS